MKKKIFALILCIISVFSLAACQPTPEDNIVEKKDTERLVEQVRENSSEQDEAAQQNTELAARLGTPERFVAENSYSDKFSMKADAEIVLPETDTLPTVRVIPADFSQDMVDKLYDYLVGDTVMYEMQLRRAKADIEEDLISWKQTLNDPNSSAEQRLQAEEKIAELSEQYEIAPETVEQQIGSSTIRELESRDYNSGELQYTYMGVKLAEDPGDDYSLNGKYFEVHQNNTGDEIITTQNVGGFSVVDTASRGASLSYGNNTILMQSLGGELGQSFRVGQITQDEWDNAGWSFVGLSPDEAKSEANELLAFIGADDMSVSSVEMHIYTSAVSDYNLDGNYAEYKAANEAAKQEFLSGKRNEDITGVTYTVHCVRQIDGVDVTSDTHSSYFDDAYGKQWYYEFLTIEVCADGIYAVYWTSPHEVTETISNDTEILPFSDIEEIINQMFRAKHDPGPENQGLFEYEINNIVLSLRRIAEPGGVESGLIIPVWDVYGESWVTYPGEPKMPRNSDNSFLTINAIDGSIIDLDKGY